MRNFARSTRAPTPDARISPETPTIESGAWNEVVEQVHEAGAQAGLLLTHAGRRGATRPRALGADLPLKDGWPLIAPSPIAYAPRMPVPLEADPDTLTRVRDEFKEAARASAAAGFDVSEVRVGRKPGTKIFTVRSGVPGAPTVMLSAEPASERASA